MIRSEFKWEQKRTQLTLMKEGSMIITHISGKIRIKLVPREDCWLRSKADETRDELCCTFFSSGRRLHSDFHFLHNSDYIFLISILLVSFDRI